MLSSCLRLISCCSHHPVWAHSKRSVLYTATLASHFCQWKLDFIIYVVKVRMYLHHVDKLCQTRYTRTLSKKNQNILLFKNWDNHKTLFCVGDTEQCKLYINLAQISIPLFAEAARWPHSGMLLLTDKQNHVIIVQTWNGSFKCCKKCWAITQKLERKTLLKKNKTQRRKSPQVFTVGSADSYLLVHVASETSRAASAESTSPILSNIYNLGKVNMVQSPDST